MKKDVSGFRGRYSVTKDGRVWSNVSNKFLVNNAGTKGYMRVCMYLDGKNYVKKIHRLVAETFIENPQEKVQVNHIDGDKNNNNINNLEWCTNTENNLHAINSGLYKTEKIRNAARKNGKKVCLLSDSQAERIRLMWEIGGTTMTEIGKLFNAKYYTISRIVNNETYILTQ